MAIMKLVSIEASAAKILSAVNPAWTVLGYISHEILSWLIEVFLRSKRKITTISKCMNYKEANDSFVHK